ncbi:hypothetical protein EDD18DRAFT_697464 [Armillaria luteobubalina]|uniref:Uncharacterized protein n=1 Tax=Armillaria luteobubalina TaxID=153913 RepID=A0AA39QIG6_9AGAR|nr:hypothetical protein EDD18DRAFT_697464 [Armillaria luteobubalina]
MNLPQDDISASGERTIAKGWAIISSHTRRVPNLYYPHDYISMALRPVKQSSLAASRCIEFCVTGEDNNPSITDSRQISFRARVKARPSSVLCAYSSPHHRIHSSHVGGKIKTGGQHRKSRRWKVCPWTDPQWMLSAILLLKHNQLPIAYVLFPFCWLIASTAIEISAFLSTTLL